MSEQIENARKALDNAWQDSEGDGTWVHVNALHALIEYAERLEDEMEEECRDRTYDRSEARHYIDKAEARAERAEAKIAAALARHTEKHGASPRYASDDYEAEREPVGWEPYVICNHDGTEWPCATVRILTGEKES